MACGALLRGQGCLGLIAAIFAPPHWSDIDRMGDREREFYTALRRAYGGLLMNGPFSIIVAFSGGLMALNDRLKLRPLIAGTSGDFLYMASEEAAIRQVCERLDTLKPLEAGEALASWRRSTRSLMQPGSLSRETGTLHRSKTCVRPASACMNMKRPWRSGRNDSECVSCRRCVVFCPTGALQIKKNEAYRENSYWTEDRLRDLRRQAGFGGTF